ncbi:undecaprenyl-diphospho-oligosaccharide flippase, putative [Geotalea daltonii FRC-32]|uniref:Probable lipid II flippase MurJ n=1 Tax=Geotalea daltonii (strain DSM 22248 / JCM 15807 / FRC-32) TaxID=316067 RepID=B9M7E6_GEODF|nr:murein biosynthesis integral membrane protein MurJ [Geotalea daltonii]ACM20234.1 undecaprenyl-diphospho-oligosaccharide flippase, putative [Geotalea daltonii FRC-32]
MSEKKNIVRAAGVLGFATILSRIMGMVRDMVQSRLFGAGFATDAFIAAYQIPNMLRRFFAEGALTSAFVPTFSEWYTQKGEEEARALANVCFTLLIVVMAVVTLLGVVFSPLIVNLMFPGFKAEPSKLELTILLNRLMFPYIFLVSLVALCMGILNTVRHFFTPAISTVFLNISVILCAVFLHSRFQVPIVSLAVGVLLGGLLQLLLQLPVLYRKGFPIRLRFDFRHPAVRRIALLMGPSIFGVGVYYLNITVGAILASYLPQGSVSYLYYAQRLFEFPQGIFTVSVAQAVLPSMSRQAAAGDMEALKESLAFGLKLTLFITIPAMAGLMLCSTPIFSLLFMGGAFDYAKAEQCGVALLYYSLGLSFVAMVRVLVPAFYALKDTRTPVVTAFIAFILNLCFSLLLMGPLRHGGLALASSLSALGNMVLLIWFLRKKIGSFGGKSILVAAGKAAVASVPMAFAVYWFMTLADWSRHGNKISKGLVLGGAVAAGIILYYAFAHLLRCEEAREATRLVRRKVLKR